MTSDQERWVEALAIEKWMDEGDGSCFAAAFHRHHRIGQSDAEPATYHC